MQENPKQNKGIKSERNVGGPEIKKEGIEAGRHARELESKGRDRI